MTTAKTPKIMLRRQSRCGISSPEPVSVCGEERVSGEMLSAFAIAPVGAPVVYTVLLLLDPFEKPDRVMASMMLLVVVLTVAYLAEALVAWPLFVILKRRRLASPVVCLAGGALIGLFVAVVFDLPEPNFARWQYYGSAGLAGSSSAALFVYTYFSRAWDG